jgi:hypothetical protein
VKGAGSSIRSSPIRELTLPSGNWGRQAVATHSGTSGACALVSGYLAIALSKFGSRTPAELSAALKAYAKPVVTGQPSGTTCVSPSLFFHVFSFGLTVE